MPPAARGNGTDKVYSLTGIGINCASPMETTTGFESCTIIINGQPAVKEEDRVGPHPRAGCSLDTSTLSTFSSTVFFENKRAGRLGDEYTSDNTIITGSPNVFIG